MEEEREEEREQEAWRMNVRRGQGEKIIPDFFQ